ncbi:MAG: peptidoglycan-binding domain-containing protein, partial [Acidimicrobiia bacterium]
MKIPVFLFALMGLFLFGAIGSLRAPVEVESEGNSPEIVFTAVTDDFPAHRGLAKPVKKGPPPPPDNSLRVGSKGPEVLALEEKLAALTYSIGKVDGLFDVATKHAVTAFQKVEGLPRNGKGDDATLN